MNPIIEAIHEQRKGHYLHALEVSTVYEAEEAIHQLYQEFKGVYLLIDIKDFFNINDSELNIMRMIKNKNKSKSI